MTATKLRLHATAIFILLVVSMMAQLLKPVSLRAATTPLGDLVDDPANALIPTPATQPASTNSTTPAVPPPEIISTSYSAKLSLDRKKSAKDILNRLINYGYQSSCLTDKIYSLSLDKIQNCSLFGVCDDTWQAKGTLTVEPSDLSKLGLIYDGNPPLAKTDVSTNAQDRFKDVTSYVNTTVAGDLSNSAAYGYESLKTKAFDRLSDARTRCFQAVGKMRNVVKLCENDDVLSAPGMNCAINQQIPGTSYYDRSLIHKLETEVGDPICDRLFPVGNYEAKAPQYKEYRDAVLRVEPNIDMCVPVFVILVTDEGGHNTWFDRFIKVFGAQPKTQVDYVEMCVPTTLTNIGDGFPVAYNSTEKLQAQTQISYQQYGWMRDKEESSKAVFRQKADDALVNLPGGPFGSNPKCRMGDDGLYFDCSLDPTAHAIMAMTRSVMGDKCTEPTIYHLGRYGKPDVVSDAKQIGSSLKAVNYGGDPIKNKAITDLEFSFDGKDKIDDSGAPHTQVILVAPYGGNNLGNFGVSGLVIEAMSAAMMSRGDRQIQETKYQGGSALFFNPGEKNSLPTHVKEGTIRGVDGKPQKITSELSSKVDNKGIPAAESVGIGLSWLSDTANNVIKPVAFKSVANPGTDPNKSYSTENFLLGNWSTAKSMPNQSGDNDPISCTKYDNVMIRLPEGGTMKDKYRNLAQATQSAADKYGVDAALVWGVLRIEGSRFLTDMACSIGKGGSSDCSRVKQGDAAVKCSLFTNTCGAVGIFQTLDKVCVPENNPCGLNPATVDDPASHGLTADKMCQYDSALDEVARRLKAAESYMIGQGIGGTELKYRVGGSWYYGMAGAAALQGDECGEAAEDVSGCYWDPPDGGARVNYNYCQCVVEYGKGIKNNGGSSAL